MHRLASLRGHLFPAAALAVGALGAVAALAPAEAAAAPPSPLSPQEFRPFKLAAIERVSHNTAVYRFALPDSQQARWPEAVLFSGHCGELTPLLAGGGPSGGQLRGDPCSHRR